MQHQFPFRTAGRDVYDPLVRAAPPIKLGIFLPFLKFAIHQHIYIVHNFKPGNGFPHKPCV